MRDPQQSAPQSNETLSDESQVRGQSAQVQKTPRGREFPLGCWGQTPPSEWTPEPANCKLQNDRSLRLRPPFRSVNQSLVALSKPCGSFGSTRPGESQRRLIPGIKYASNSVTKPIIATRNGWASKAKGSMGTETRGSIKATTLILRSGKKSRLHNTTRIGIASTAVSSSQLGAIFEA